MLNRRELLTPILPKSAKPNFFDFELKYLEIESALEDSKKIGRFYSLLTLILFIKPIVLLQICRINDISSFIYLSIFASFFGEVFIAYRKWLKNSTLSWHWIPMISLVASILLAATGDYFLAFFGLAFTGIEFTAVFVLEKYKNGLTLWKMEFFTDNLWQDAQQLGKINDCEEYSIFRIRKTSVLVKLLVFCGIAITRYSSHLSIGISLIKP